MLQLQLWHHPLQRIMTIDVEGAGENIFLVVHNVQEQLSQERFGPLCVPGIKDAVTAI